MPVDRHDEQSYGTVGGVMPRKSTGGIVEKPTTRGISFGLRFRALGRRQFVHLGYAADGWTRERAEQELTYTLAQVERGDWQPPTAAPVVEEALRDPGFHAFASEWFEAKRLEVRPNTIAAYENELSHHLLPFFHAHRLSQITVAEVDRYREHKLRHAEAHRQELAAWEGEVRGAEAGPGTATAAAQCDDVGVLHQRHHRAPGNDPPRRR
jgi:hypothetical protein